MKADETGAGGGRPPLATDDAGRMDRLALASMRVPFRLKVALVWIVIFVILGWFFYIAGFDAKWMIDKLSFIAGGLRFTILMAAGGILLAMILALLGALGRLSRNPVAYGVSGFYTSFFRGTPLIVQLFLLYLALPQIGSNLADRFDWMPSSLGQMLTFQAAVVGIIGLGLNYGAYMTEIFRAGIQSVGHGQGEAADALGMTYRKKMRRVVLPQALRVIIPPTGNEFIAMMKDTALVGFLGASVATAEIFRRSQLVGKRYYRNLEAYIVAAALYWMLTAIFTFFQARLEKRMSKGYVRGAATPAAKPPKFVSGSAAGGTGGGGMMVEIEELGSGAGPGPEEAEAKAAGALEDAAEPEGGPEGERGEGT